MVAHRGHWDFYKAAWSSLLRPCSLLALYSPNALPPFHPVFLSHSAEETYVNWVTVVEFAGGRRHF
eukprot:1159783-Pelagomonas_calceolata.AAC.11